MKGLVIFHTKNVSIIDQRIFAVPEGVGEGRPVGSVFVVILLDSWVKDQFFQGIMIVDVQKFFELILFVFATSCFDRNLHIEFIKDFIKEVVQFIRIKQKAGSPFPVYNCFRRAAEIQIDFFIAESFQLPGKADKVFGTVCQDLWNCVHAFIIFRKDLIPFLSAEFSFRIRVQEWGEIFIHGFKKGVVRPAVYLTCNAFHRCKIDFHNLSTSVTISVPSSTRKWIPIPA